MFLVYCVLVAWSAQSFVSAECPTIISQQEWDATPAKYAQYLPIPLDLVIVQHTVTQTCSDDTSCAEVVRDLQKTHREKSLLWDIAPSFLIGGNGKVYEGRGWLTVGQHTPGYNNQSYSLAFIGNFNNAEPSDESLNSAKKLVECGVEEEYLTKDYKVVVHKQLVNTESPGMKLFSQVKSWAHWLADVTEIKKRADKLPQTEVQKQKSIDNNEEDKAVILKTPSDIDSLTNIRNSIAKLINSLRDVALNMLDTAGVLKRELDNKFKVLLDGFSSVLNSLKDKMLTVIGSTPSFSKASSDCLEKLQKKADNNYSEAEKQIRTCSDKRYSQINAMIENLKEFSNSTLDFTNNAFEKANNCTELNYGITAPTKSCIVAESNNVKSETAAVEKQKKLILDSIQLQVQDLPAALEVCSKKPLQDASLNTHKLIADAADCTTKGAFGFFS